MSGWVTWPEKQEEYHENNEKRRKACVDRAKCCFICKVPKGAIRIGEDGEEYIVFLAAAHLEHDPYNGKARMKALCQDCHNKWDGKDRQKNVKVSNAQKREKDQSERGQMLANWKIKGDQDRLRRRNRRDLFVDAEWKIRNLKRYSVPSSDRSPQAEQLSLFVEEDDELFPCIQVDYPIMVFLQSK